MHALNNAVGKAWQTEEDMQHACGEFYEECKRDGLDEDPDAHEGEGGAEAEA